MRLAAGTGMILRPADPPVPFEWLSAEWQRLELEPRACRGALERLVEERGIPGELFCPEEIERGGRPATDALVFDFFSPARDWICVVQTGGSAPRRAGVRMPPAAVGSFARLLRALAEAGDADALRAAADPGLPPKLVGLLCGGVEPAAEARGPHGAWPRIDAPGIYRREHASLVVRSRTTTLLVDPQGLHLAESSNFGRYPLDPRPLDPDAVVITHHHDDHWHLPTILHHAGPRGVPVVVPVTPRPNLLTGEDFAASLARLGLPAVPMPWHTTLRIGDIEIDALPFYGEQPTRDGPGPAAGLRSWGNCYRFTTPELSALLLVDSGVDPLGSMVEVARRSRAERGPVDVVLANCRRFPDVLNAGLAHYAFALPFERVRASYLDRCRGVAPSMTLGEAGIAEVCEAAEARYFLPYAHMFAGLGADVDGAALEGVRRELARRGAATEAVAWRPGDAARLAGDRPGSRLEIEAPREGAPAAAARRGDA